MISTPAKVEARGMHGLPVGDCDDFSIYAATAIQQMSERSNGVLSGKVVKEVSLLTVPWLEKNGIVSGHNVCVFRYLTTDGKWWWAWVSNWYDCRIQWEMPNGALFETPAQIAAFMSRAADAVNLRWARVSVDLKKVFDSVLQHSQTSMSQKRVSRASSSWSSFSTNSSMSVSGFFSFFRSSRPTTVSIRLQQYWATP